MGLPDMDRVVLILVVTALASLGVSGCGFQNQGCSSGRSDRERRDIVFPGEDEFDDDVHPITRYLTPEQIEMLNSLDTVDEVVRKFSNHSHDVEPPIVSARILPQLTGRIGGGSAGEARSPAVKQAVPAKCQPTLQPVALKKPDDLTIMYWPYCVQLEQCSGCCINDRQQSCQPTRTEQVPFKVTKFLIKDMVRNGTAIIHLERHLECKCSCIVRAEHCNALQEYSPRECRCNCGNADEKRKCLSEPNKLWDNKDCKCRCREFPAEGCTTGLYFDPNTCTCAAIPTSRRHYSDSTYKVQDKRRRRWQNKTSNPTMPPLL